MDIGKIIEKIRDHVLRDGVEAAISKTLIPAAPQKAYPGHFTVTADGAHFGAIRVPEPAGRTVPRL